MNRTGTATLMMAFILLLGSVAAVSEILHVPRDYPTIQAAIDAANSGDTVLIVGGTFAERIVIDKDIAIQGDPSCGATLDAHGGSAITILRGIVSVSDLSLLHGGEDVTILDPHVLGDGAMSIRGDAHVVVQRCSFAESEMGIAIRDQSSAVLAHCEFTGVDLPVLVAEAGDCMVRDCRLMRGKWALRCIMDSHVEIARSHVEDFKYVAMHLSSNAVLSMRESTVSAPGNWGIKADGGRATLRDCRLARSKAGETFSRGAIQGSADAQIEIVDSMIEGGKEAVLTLEFRAEAVIARSELLGFADHAVCMSDESFVEMNETAVRGARWSGIQQTGSSVARAVVCTFEKNGSGIALSERATATLVDCAFLRNRQDALAVHDSAEAHMLGCSIEHSICGISLQEEAICSFANGSVIGCRLAAISVQGDAAVELTDVALSRNGIGIAAFDRSSIGLFRCTLRENEFGVCLACSICSELAPASEYRGDVSGCGNTISGNASGDLCPEAGSALWPERFTQQCSIHVPADYATVQEAIDAAEPGSTIIIAGGRYRERLHINKAISLTRTASEPSILVPPDGSGDIVSLEAGCGDVRISNLQLGSTSTAIRAHLHPGDSLCLRNVAVVSVDCGIDLQGDGALSAKDCFIGDVRTTGVLIEDSIVVVQDCVFTNPQLRPGTLFRGNGIVLIGGATASIGGNLIVEHETPVSIRETRTLGATTEIRRPFTGSVSGSGNRGDFGWSLLLPVPRNPNAPWPKEFFDLTFGESSAEVEQQIWSGMNALFGDENPSAAIGAFREAIASLVGISHPLLEAEVLVFLSMAEHAADLRVEASEHYVRALELSERYHFDLISTAFLQHIGDARTHTYFSSLMRFTEGFQAAWSAFWRARRAISDSDYLAAIDAAEGARGHLAELPAGAAGQGWERELLWQTLLLLGDSYRQMDRIEDAIQTYRASIEVIESLGVAISRENLRLFWYERSRQVYEHLADLLFQIGEGIAAFQYVERCRARTFLDLVAAGPIDTLAAVAEQGIRSGVVEAATIESDLAEVVAGLPTDTAAIEYFVTDEATYVWVVRDGTTSMSTKLCIDRSSLRNQILDFRAMIETPMTGLMDLPDEATLAMSRDLHELLVAPIAGQLESIEHLVIIPSGPLHYLPFSALLDCSDCEGVEFLGGEYLIERFSLSYMPSLTTLKYAWLSADEVQTDGLFLALADPSAGDSTLPRLPDAQEEATTVSGLFDTSEVYVDADATEEIACLRASSAGQLLLATHGLFNPLNPMLSYLLLSPTEETDGRLYTHEIFGLDLHTDLVTLSACETLLPAIRKMEEDVRAIRGMPANEDVELTEELLETLTAGDEIVGLARAFLYAGAPSVLSTLWQVVSETTEPLIVTFYGYLQQGLDKAEALRQAQIDVMAMYPHPRYWAPFELVGDWRTSCDLACQTSGKVTASLLIALEGWITGSITSSAPVVRVLVVLHESVTEAVAEAITAVSPEIQLESGYDRMILVSMPVDQLVALSRLPEIAQIIEPPAMSSTP